MLLLICEPWTLKERGEEFNDFGDEVKFPTETLFDNYDFHSVLQYIYIFPRKMIC